MGISSGNHASGVNDSSGVARNISVIGWGKAIVGIAAVMLIPDSADAQPASNDDDLPQVRVTAPKRAAKRQTVRHAPGGVAPAPGVRAPSQGLVRPHRDAGQRGTG